MRGRGFIIAHTLGVLEQMLPPSEVPTSHGIYEEPAATPRTRGARGGTGWGVYGKVTAAPHGDRRWAGQHDC